MAFVTVSNWATDGMSNDLIATASKGLVPIIMDVGASSVEVLQTGEASFCVVAHFCDAEKANAAQTKISMLQEQSATKLPMRLKNYQGGELVDSAWPAH
jgi:hypothetical protein